MTFISGADVATCVRSIADHAPHAVVVVDNASAGASEAITAGFSLSVTSIRNAVSVGFASRVNQGSPPLAASPIPNATFMTPPQAPRWSALTWESDQDLTVDDVRFWFTTTEHHTLSTASDWSS